jgi:hypothetical protein
MGVVNLGDGEASHLSTGVPSTWRSTVSSSDTGVQSDPSATSDAASGAAPSADAAAQTAPALENLSTGDVASLGARIERGSEGYVL